MYQPHVLVFSFFFPLRLVALSFYVMNLLQNGLSYAISIATSPITYFQCLIYGGNCRYFRRNKKKRINMEMERGEGVQCRPNFHPLFARYLKNWWISTIFTDFLQKFWKSKLKFSKLWNLFKKFLQSCRPKLISTTYYLNTFLVNKCIMVWSNLFKSFILSFNF